jgi:hypothetical protein
MMKIARFCDIRGFTTNRICGAPSLARGENRMPYQKAKADKPLEASRRHLAISVSMPIMVDAAVDKCFNALAEARTSKLQPSPRSAGRRCTARTARYRARPNTGLRRPQASSPASPKRSPAARCSHAVRLIPRRLASASMRASTCVSKRRVTVATPVSSSGSAEAVRTGAAGGTLSVSLGAAPSSRSSTSAVRRSMS